jgi:hypothetical protein
MAGTSRRFLPSCDPFRPGAEVTAGIAAYGFSAAERQSIERGAAINLLPRLKT